MTHGYEAFGLIIRSNRELPGLRATASAGHVDLDIEFAAGLAPEVDAEARNTTADTGWGSVGVRADGGRVLRYASHGGTLVWSTHVSGDGRSIEVRWRGPIELADVASFVESGGISTALALRGVPLLHACAIEAGAGAFLVLGAAGSGKSTLAAAAVARGHALLADDIAALDDSPPGVIVHPGASRLRMNEDTARAVGWDPDRLERVFATPELPPKVFAPLATADGTLCDRPRPVTAIFELGGRHHERLTIEPLAPAAALPVLLRNTYGDATMDARLRSRQLPFWTRLAQHVPICAVTPPDDLDAAADVVEELAAWGAISTSAG